MYLKDHFIVPLFFAASVGCQPTGEDSWKHYQGGGNYSARTPCMSPDGAVIAFSSPRTGNGDIYLIDPDGASRTRLTTDPAFETDPIFSPDGSTIAFAREQDRRRHIWLMDRSGGNVKQLTFGKFLDDVFSFSPDGLELNFYRSPLSFGMGRTVTPYAVSLATGAIRKLTGVGIPEYSPDGTCIANYEPNSSSGRYEIWLTDADGTNRRFLVEGNSPRFSPDGHTILYSTELTYPGRLWNMIDIDGINNYSLGRMEDPVFTEDGNHIVCLSPDWQRQIWKLDLSGANREVLNLPVGYLDFFRRCPDGFVIKLVTDDRVGDIYLIDTSEWKAKHVASMN